MTESYTIAEASARTGLSKRAIARRIERGQLAATKVGRLRYVTARELAEVGLLDLATGAPPPWAAKQIRPELLSREIVQTLVDQTIELHELRRALRALESESRRDDVALREELERAASERLELRRLLDEARERITDLQDLSERVDAARDSATRTTTGG